MDRRIKFPISDNNVALFIAYMDRKGYAKGTIISYVSAIGYFHRTLNLKELASSNLIKRSLAGLSKDKVKPRRKPIQIKDLIRLVKASKAYLPKREDITFRTIALLLFYGFFRISEVVGDKRVNIPPLSREDIKLHRDKIYIRLNQYKHSKGNIARVTIKRQNNSSICPVNTLHEYLNEFGKDQLKFVNKFGSPLTKNSFSRLLRKCSQSAGYKTHFTSHCFRIGAATHASRLGHSEIQIKAMGRWRSQAYVGYIRKAKPLMTKGEKARDV